MRKLSKINESVFKKVIDRSDEKETRTEDSLEVKLEEFLDNDYKREKEDYYIENNMVCCKSFVEIHKNDLINGELPFQFGYVAGDFFIMSKDIISLKGCPEETGGFFTCTWCSNLTSLEGAPQKVGSRFDCSHCKKLTSLDGAPQEVGGHFFCNNCGKKFSESDLPEGIKLEGIFFN